MGRQVCSLTERICIALNIYILHIRYASSVTSFIRFETQLHKRIDSDYIYLERESSSSIKCAALCALNGECLSASFSQLDDACLISEYRINGTENQHRLVVDSAWTAISKEGHSGTTTTTTAEVTTSTTTALIPISGQSATTTTTTDLLTTSTTFTTTAIPTTITAPTITTTTTATTPSTTTTTDSQSTSTTPTTTTAPTITTTTAASTPSSTTTTTTTTTTSLITTAICNDRRPVQIDTVKYEILSNGVWIEMTCAPGTIFDVAICNCNFPPPG